MQMNSGDVRRRDRYEILSLFSYLKTLYLALMGVPADVNLHTGILKYTPRFREIYGVYSFTFCDNLVRFYHYFLV